MSRLPIPFRSRDEEGGLQSYRLCPVIGLWLRQLVCHKMLNVFIKLILTVILYFFNITVYLIEHTFAPDKIIESLKVAS